MDSVRFAHLAPAAWVAVLGAVLALVLARWYDRVPWRVLALFALLLLLFFGEVLLGGAVLLPLDNLRGEPPFLDLAPTVPHGNVLQGDLLYLVQPLRVEVRRAVAAGAWPLWTPRMGAGAPLLANPQAQALQPLAAAGLALPALAAPGAVAALRTLVALVFTYLLLVRLGAGVGPALAGALAFGLGGFLQLWLGWPLANTAALLPAVLYAVVLSAERGARRDWTLLAVVLAALLVAGHPETVAYAAVLAAGLALAEARRRGGAAFLGRAAGAAVLAALLAAPALLPFAAHLPDTLRWSRTAAWTVPPEPDGGAGAPPATRVIQAAAPQALGNSRFAHYWGVANSNEDAGGFVGTAALLAALLALPGWIGGPRPVRHEGAALWVAGGCLALLALPGGTSLFGWGRVPAGGLSGRLALPLTLALAVLAAATLERLRGPERPRWLVAAALPAAAGALALLHLWAVPALAHPADPATLAVLRGGWLHWHLRFLAAAAVVLLLGRRRHWPAVAVAALVAAELLLAHEGVNPPMPRRLAFPVTPALQVPLAATGGGEGAAAPGRLAAGGRVLLPNLAAVYGLSDVRVYDPAAPAPYLGLLAPGIERWIGEIPLLGPSDAALYDRLGVAWWLAAPGAPCPQGAVPVHAGRDATVCRRPGALPLIRRVPAGRAGDSEWGAVVSAVASAAGDRWRVGLAGAAPGRVETGIYAAPGWRVLGDLRPVPARRDVLLAADLPAGTRRVDLLYRPAPFVAGCLLAAAGLALAVAGLARPPALPSPRRRDSDTLTP